MSEARKQEIAELKAADPVLAGKAKCTQEMPVHRDLEVKVAWNCSNSVSRSCIGAWQRELQSRAQANSVARCQGLKNYIPPHKVRFSKRFAAYLFI